MECWSIGFVGSPITPIVRFRRLFAANEFPC